MRYTDADRTFLWFAVWALMGFSLATFFIDIRQDRRIDALEANARATQDVGDGKQ